MSQHPESPASDATATASATPGNSQLPIILLCVACLILPVVGELIVTSCNKIFYPPPHNQMGDPPEYTLAVRNAMMTNYGIGYGIYGAIFFGVAGVLLSMNKKKNVLLSIVFGGLAGLIGAAIGHFIDASLKEIDFEGMLKAAAILSPIYLFFSLIGSWLAGAGKSESNASVGIATYLGNGIIAAIIALAAYITLATSLFPLDRPETMYPVTASLRYTHFYMLTFAALIAAFLTLRAAKSNRNAKSS